MNLRTRGRAVLLLIGGSAAVRLLLAAVLGLSEDEAYTVAMSRRLSLSYFDHPPLMYWLTGATSRLAGTEDALVVRGPSWSCSRPRPGSSTDWVDICSATARASSGRCF